MTRLITDPNVERHDDIYARLIELHAGKSEQESALLNARLILLLINHLGDTEAVMEAIALAAQRPDRPDQLSAGAPEGSTE